MTDQGEIQSFEMLAATIAEATAASAAAMEMRWREAQERRIRWEHHVLPAEEAAEEAVRRAVLALQSEIYRRAREVEDARLATVPEQSEWHIYVHGVKTPGQYATCEDCNYDKHTCPGCGEWLYHGKGACGPCEEEG